MTAEPAIAQTRDSGGAAAPAAAEATAAEVTPAEVSPAEFRRAMGTFATGVTVVTGMSGDQPIGFACQAFSSVSLEPPLVLFCADHKGRSWPLIRESGRFCVNVLAERQSEICARFGSSKGRKFEGLDWEASPWGVPMLPDVLLRVHAEVYDVHVAGDHDVVIGRVLGIETASDDRPMVFFRGRFGIDRDEPRQVGDLWGWGDHWG